MYVALCIDWSEQEILAMLVDTQLGAVLKQGDDLTDKYLGSYSEIFTQDKTGHYMERLNQDNTRSVLMVKLYEQKSPVLL